MAAPSLSWLKNIQDELALAQKIPLFGAPPAFPWAMLSEELQKNLEIPSFSCSSAKQGFCPPEKFLTSFGKKPVVHVLELAPLEGSIYWVLSSESMEKLTLLLASPQEEQNNWSCSSLQEGFYQYLLLNAANSFSKVSPYTNLQLQWVQERPLPIQASYCIDLALSFGKEQIPARLILSQEFHANFSSHFTDNLLSFLESPLLDTMNVSVRVETGYCNIALTTWNKAQIGDFLVLDSCSYDPALNKGTACLILEKTALFQIKLKKDKIHILDYSTKGDSQAMEEYEDKEFDSLFPIEDEGPAKEEAFLNEEKDLSEEILSSAAEISLPIVVEIGRFEIPLKKLLSLEPGNVLELSIQPEQGVYLTVHGKKIAKGELLKLGNTIGVTITKLGNAPSL